MYVFINRCVCVCVACVYMYTHIYTYVCVKKDQSKIFIIVYKCSLKSSPTTNSVLVGFPGPKKVAVYKRM